jgi:hypothetical protein
MHPRSSAPAFTWDNLPVQPLHILHWVWLLVGWRAQRRFLLEHLRPEERQAIRTVRKREGKRRG